MTITAISNFALQNAQSTGLAAHEITFNEVFAQGQMPKGSQLYAVINGVSYAVQLDVKTSYADGSVKSGIITLDAPAIAAGATLQGQLFLGSGSAAPAVDISRLPGSGYNFVVNLTLHNSDGTTTPYQLNAGTLLSQALQAGKVSYWMQGPQATEVRFDVPIGGSFHVTFDLTDFADGTTRTEVQFNNDYAEQPVGGAVTYDERITQNGVVLSQYSGLTQYQYQTRHEVFWSNGAPQVNIVHDIAALEKTGAIPGYNLAYSSSASQTLGNYATQMAGSGWGGPLPVDGVDQYMPDPGGRPDIIVDNGGTLAPWGGEQVRGKAWGLREIDEAAYANPDGSAEKAYFTQVSNDNWSWLVSQLPTWTAAQGQAYGQIQGAYGSNGSM